MRSLFAPAFTLRRWAIGPAALLIACTLIACGGDSDGGTGTAITPPTHPSTPPGTAEKAEIRCAP